MYMAITTKISLICLGLRVGKGGVKGGTREEKWVEGIEWKWRKGRVGLKV
jgi:hypothetical protein